MNKEISEMVWVAVDIIGGIILLLFLIGAQSQARQLFSTMEARDVAEDILAENKEWRGYEGDFVTSADICNLVATHGGEKHITIIYNATVGNTYYQNCKDSTVTVGPSGSFMLNNSIPQEYTSNKNSVTGAPDLPNTNKFVTNFSPYSLNTVLNEELNYTVKIYRDTSNVVRYISVQSWKPTAAYSNVVSAIR